VSNAVRLAWIAVAGPVAYFNFGPLALIAVFCLSEAAAAPYFLWKLKQYDLLNLREEFFIIAAMLIGAAIGYGCYASIEAMIAAGTLPDF